MTRLGVSKKVDRKSKAREEVPSNCILSSSQQVATCLVITSVNSFLMSLWPQSLVSNPLQYKTLLRQ